MAGCQNLWQTAIQAVPAATASLDQQTTASTPGNRGSSEFKLAPVQKRQAPMDGGLHTAGVFGAHLTGMRDTVQFWLASRTVTAAKLMYIRSSKGCLCSCTPQCDGSPVMFNVCLLLCAFVGAGDDNMKRRRTGEIAPTLARQPQHPPLLSPPQQQEQYGTLRVPQHNAPPPPRFPPPPPPQQKAGHFNLKLPQSHPQQQRPGHHQQEQHQDMSSARSVVQQQALPGAITHCKSTFCQIISNVNNTKTAVGFCFCSSSRSHRHLSYDQHPNSQQQMHQISGCNVLSASRPAQQLQLGSQPWHPGTLA